MVEVLRMGMMSLCDDYDNDDGGDYDDDDADDYDDDELPTRAIATSKRERSNK